jgi:hypothetical protein
VDGAAVSEDYAGLEVNDEGVVDVVLTVGGNDVLDRRRRGGGPVPGIFSTASPATASNPVAASNSDVATATKRERVGEEGTGTETALRRGNGAAKPVPGSPRASAPFTVVARSIVESTPESPVPKPWFGGRRPLYGSVAMLV